MNRLMIFLVFMVALTGCSTPQILQDSSQLGVKTDTKTLYVSAEKIVSDRIVLSRLVIERILYKVGTDHIVYEEAYVQPPYRFHHSTTDTLYIVFNAKSIKTLDYVGNLWFYRIGLRSGGFLYVAAQNKNSTGLVMVYGLRAEQMQKLIKEVGGKTDAPFGADADAAVRLPASRSAFLSGWNAKMIISDNLLERIGYGL
jgi:hypothetical protein